VLNGDRQLAGIDMAKFTVDTHLFRELGELLVGRDSTALIELIKNSYDADATRVTVHGEQLDHPELGRIVVSDDGTGMTLEQFERGFLCVASRLKEQDQRRSENFHRRYTGAKGIGRLAAHKLACVLEVNSIPSQSGAAREALHAVIDWDKIEKFETLDEVNEADAILVETSPARRNARAGTSLTLTKLRRAWTPSERARFFAEVQSFDPPTFLETPLPKSLLPEPILFECPIVRDDVRDGKTPDRGFRVTLEGDFAAGDEYWQLIAENASWILEIRAAQGDREVHFGIAPTTRTRSENPEARRFESRLPHPDPTHGPFFDARVLVREGRLKGKNDQRVWASQASGIRVYLEGFRVLPYGESKDDWLSIDYDYTRRPRQLELLQDLALDADATDPDEGLIRLPSNNYFGAVFLTQERAPSLRILVNREGFIPEAGFDQLVKLIRTGVDLCTRVRAAAAFARRQKRKEARSGRGRGGTRDTPGAGRTRESGADEEGPQGLPARLQEAEELIQRARTLASEGNVDAATEATNAAVIRLGQAKNLAADVISERALLRVLASVGTQMAAFVHEINALLGTTQTVVQALSALLEDKTLPSDHRRKLTQTIDAATELKRGLERQASYLMDVVTPDARRRRSRQRLGERFDAAIRLIQHQAERRGIEILNEVSSDLKSPPMFPAELTTVFANLLTNAVKAAGRDGRIHAGAREDEDKVVVRIQNTGAAVDLVEADRWFKPFESTTSEVDPVLGQGMGLGLTITRSVLESYGATVTFVKPDRGYSTSVQVAFPK
jgi:signal transduction histidine kinase